MFRDNSMVTYTCPYIDDVKDVLSEIVDVLDDFDFDGIGELRESVRNANYVILEQIRGFASALREWGNNLYDDLEDQRTENDNLREQIEYLENKIYEYEQSCKE